MTNTNTITISTVDDYIHDEYTVDTIDISSSLTSDYSIDWDYIEITDTKRTSLRDSGTIPLDIWAKMYNNNKLEDD